MIEEVSGPVWECGGWEGLRPLEGAAKAEFCVIGLGGSGLTCIEELCRRGRKVIGLDAGRVGGGAAGRNGGFLLAGSADFYHDAVERLGREVALEIYHATMAELERIFESYPGIARRTGSLRIAGTAVELADCRAQMSVMETDGLPVEWYDGPEGEGLLFPLDGAFQPLERCREQARRVIAAGARLCEGSPVRSIAPGRVVTPQGTVECESIVVAVDGRLEALLPELAGRVRTARLQMLATAPALDVDYPRPVYLRHGFEYWQQLPDRSIALGGFRDLGGEDEWTDSTAPSKTVQQSLERLLRQRIGTRAQITHRWAASVGYTTSGTPICEEVRPGVHAIGGYNGTGNLIGAILARRLAESIG